MSKTVLMARPHPFILNEMLPFLQKCGYAPRKPESVEELASLAKESDAAVISLAVTSPIAATPEEVVKTLEREAPNTRLLFASLMPWEQARPVIERIAKDAGVPITIVSLADINDATRPALGNPKTYLYISKLDLGNPALHEQARSIIARHFG